jgi:tRNA(Ile)-lysidine synthase
MLKFIGDLPRKCTIAFSGGIDSVVISDFLLNGKRDVTLAFFHHGTINSERAEEFVRKFAEERHVPLRIGRINSKKSKDVSPEEFWRNERYTFLDSLGGPVVTGHHLGDAIETWIFTSLHGESKLIPYSRGNVIRPFLVTPKEEIRSWASRRNLTWIEDESNSDPKYMRNLIRMAIVPEALKVNPGIGKVLKKKYELLMASEIRVSL